MSCARLSPQSPRVGGFEWGTHIAVATPVLPYLLVGLLALLVGAAPEVAGAHEGEAAIDLVSLDASPDPLVLDMSVNITFAADGHAVSDAAVTVTGDSDAGASLTPATLIPAGDGLFGAKVVFPEAGTWNLRVICVTPSGQLDLDPVVVEGAETTATKPQTNDAVGGVGDGGDAAGVEGEGTVIGTPPVPSGEHSNQDTSESSPWLIALAVVLVVAVVSAVILQKRSSAAGAGESGGVSDESGSDRGGEVAPGD